MRSERSRSVPGARFKASGENGPSPVSAVSLSLLYTVTPSVGLASHALAALAESPTLTMSWFGGQSIEVETPAVVFTTALPALTWMTWITEVLLGALATTVIVVLAPAPPTVVLNLTWLGSFGLPAGIVAICWPFTVIVILVVPVAVPDTGTRQEDKTCPSTG